LSTLNRTAAEIAAAALVETFPDVELLGGRDTSVGFFYDFYFPHPLSSESEIFLEERMRQIARERRPIRTLEMVPVSAKEFLIKKGRASRVEEIGFENTLVEIIEMGSFIDLSFGPHLKNSNELSSFKLWPIETLQQGQYRLTGCAFSTKEELKNFLKKFRAYKDKSHLVLGEKKSLWKIWKGEVLWLREGIKGRSELIECLKSHLFKESLEVEFSSEEDRIKLHGNLAVEIKKIPLHLGEIYRTPLAPWDPDSGLLSGEGGSWIQISSYISSSELEGALISSLQSVGKTLNILGFKYSFRLMGRSRSEKSLLRLEKALQGLKVEFELDLQENHVPRIDLLVKDNLGRLWEGFSWELMEKGFFLIGSIERLYALLLERSV